MTCENLITLPVWTAWILGIWGVLGFIGTTLEIYLNVTKERAERLQENNHDEQ
jgi:hypothetical protein